MLRRSQSDVRSGNCNALPPIQLVNLAYAEFREKCPVAEAGDEPRRVLLLQPQQRLDVQVVIVVVGDEQYVDAREPWHLCRRLHQALGADE